MRKAALLLLILFNIGLYPAEEVSNAPCRVYVDGIWDLFHEGHIRLFEQAIQKAKQTFPDKNIELVVGVCGTPEEVAVYKRPTIMTLEERSLAVASCALVSEIITQAPVFGLEQAFIDANRIDLVIHGDDFSEDSRQKYYGVAIKLGKFVMVPYTKGISTTQLLEEAVKTGTITYTLEHTKIPKMELISRILSRQATAPT